jgi:TldD protein
MAHWKAELSQSLLRSGAEYADVRTVERIREWLVVRNGEPVMVTHTVDQGTGVRVRVGGAFGYAATPDAEPSAVRAAATRALDAAKAAARSQVRAATLPKAAPSVGEYATTMQKDPLQVSTEEKLALLRRATDAARRNPAIGSAQATSVVLRLRSELHSSEGTHTEQTIVLTGGGVMATAVRGGEMQRRSWPKPEEGDLRQAGWEYVESLRLEDEAERVREEAVELLTADKCPSGLRTVILDGSQLSLHVHETCGHPTELDRALGEELSLAGGSFLTPDKLHSRYGSDLVNLTADGTTPGGPGTFGWDDEGTPARRTPLVHRGEFVGYLSARASAAQLGVQSAGACRADTWSSIPIVRMVNINLEPGAAGTLEELVQNTEDGVLLSTNRSWSIDSLRLNFQFACEVAWEIRDGRRVRMLRNPIYTGITPQFWGGCDAICSESDWRMWGYLFCGKGDPIQLIHVGHGVAPARFRNVRLGA